VLQIVLSASTALYLLMFRTGSFVGCLLNVAVSGGAWYHFAPFWAGQKRVPAATQWNEAVEASGTLRTLLVALAGAWGVAGVGGFVGF
jgi:hypothetical protein